MYVSHTPGYSKTHKYDDDNVGEIKFGNKIIHQPAANICLRNIKAIKKINGNGKD